MNYKDIFLNSFIAEFPSIYSYNNKAIKRYLDVIYNPDTGVVVVPVNTTGKVKGATGEFVTTITDNLIVKRQWTNMYENVSSIDKDYYYAYIGQYDTYRDPSIWENQNFNYIDVVKHYYKITNDASLAFKSMELGQEIHILFDTSTLSSSNYSILLDPSINGSQKIVTVEFSDADLTWLKLINVKYDASYGNTWAIKEYGGSISLL